jgi:excisionase family DNA binding protein
MNSPRESEVSDSGTECAPEAATGDATPDAATLSRREAAEVLGVDERTVRRMAADGRLTTVLGTGGSRRFRAEEVREITIHRRVSNTLTLGDSAAGETAATLFTLFDQGVHPVEAVKRLRLDPRAVSAFYREWAELRGGLFIPERVLREMTARFHLSAPLRDASHLLKDLERMWPKARCTECGQEEPTTCAECTARISVEAARQRAVAERVQRETRSLERAMARLDGPFDHGRRRSAAGGGSAPTDPK